MLLLVEGNGKSRLETGRTSSKKYVERLELDVGLADCVRQKVWLDDLYGCIMPPLEKSFHLCLIIQHLADRLLMD